MLFPILLALTLCLSIGYFILTGKDAWPFSAYPMFSNSIDIPDVAVFRLALETQSGEVVWWKPHYYNYERNFGHEFVEILGQIRHDKTLAEQRWRELLTHTVSLIRTEEGLDRFKALHVVQRTVQEKPTGDFEFLDHVVLKVSIDNILSGELSF